MELDEKEKELLEKLKKAGKQDSKFCLTLTIDDEVLASREFAANKFSNEAVVSTRTHFMMNDLIRIILKHYEENEHIFQEQKKKEEIEKMWNDKDKKIK